MGEGHRDWTPTERGIDAAQSEYPRSIYRQQMDEGPEGIQPVSLHLASCHETMQEISRIMESLEVAVSGVQPQAPGSNAALEKGHGSLRDSSGVLSQKLQGLLKRLLILREIT